MAAGVAFSRANAEASSTGVETSRWTLRAPLGPTFEDLRSAAVDPNSGTIVAVGSGGTVLTKPSSSDKWDAQTLSGEGSSYGPQSVVWTGTHFVTGAYSERGLHWSVDGITWETVPGTREIAFEANKIVGQGQTLIALDTSWTSSETLYWRSTDGGRTWSKRKLPNPPVDSDGDSRFGDIAANDRGFVVVGTGGAIYFSPDGLDWEPVGPPSDTDTTFWAVVASESAFMASGWSNVTYRRALLHSPDGRTWSAAPLPGTDARPDGVGSIYGLSNGFVVFGNTTQTYDDGTQLSGVLYYFWSDHAEDWEFLGEPYGDTGGAWNGEAQAVVAVSGGYLFFGNGGLIASFAANVFALGVENYLGGWWQSDGSMAGLGNAIVAVPNPGSGSIVFSPDGETFDSTLIQGDGVTHVARIDNKLYRARHREVFYDNGGDSPPEMLHTVGLETSSNGLDWSSEAVDLDIRGQVVALAKSPGRVVVMSLEYEWIGNPQIGSYGTTGNRIARVYAGDTWANLEEIEESEPYPSNSAVIPSVSWDGKRFIRLSHEGRLFTSSNGSEWIPLPSAIPADNSGFIREFFSGGVPLANLALSFASNNDKLVVRPAKRSTDGYIMSYGPDRFFTYDFGTGLWTMSYANERRNRWSWYGGGNVVWTGEVFASPNDDGQVCTSSDGLVWQTRQAGSTLSHLVWTGNQLVGITQSMTVWTHPNGLTSELYASQKSVEFAIGGDLYVTLDRNIYYSATDKPIGSEIGEALLLLDARGRPLAASTFTASYELMLAAGAQIGVSRNGNVLSVALPGFLAGRGGSAPTFSSLKLYEFDALSGQQSAARLPSYTSRQLSDVLAQETVLAVDLTGDGVVGDGVLERVGAGLWVTASGAIYYSEQEQTVGQPVVVGVMLKDTRGNALSAAVFARGYELMLAAGAQIGVSRNGNVLSVALPGFLAGRGGSAPTFSSLKLYEFDALSGQQSAARLPSYTSRQLSDVLAAESEFGQDYNGDGITGDGVLTELGGGLYATQSGGLYHSEATETEGTAIHASARLLRDARGNPLLAARFAPNANLLPLTTSEVASWEPNPPSGVLKVAIPRFNMSARNRVVGMSNSNQPDLPRFAHSQVWTGSKLIIWGGEYLGEYLDENWTKVTLDSGGVYDPRSDSWSEIADDDNAPSARSVHTAVWTGSEMIVWGGIDGNLTVLNSGARYDPENSRWSPMRAAPQALYGHTAVWTGTEMIVWGDASNGDSGMAYNPGTDQWRLISSDLAPAPRMGHGAVWTGSEMIVWGGSEGDNSSGTSVGTGAFYDPVQNIWTPITSLGAPVGGDGSFAEYGERGVELMWSGSCLIAMPVNTYNEQTNAWERQGGIYDPVSESWTLIQATGSPNVRPYMAAYTRDGRLFAGGSMNNSFNGLAYDFVRKRWTRIMSATTGSFQGRQGTWVPELDEMLVFGGMWANTALSFSGGQNGNRGFRLQLSTPVFASLAIHEFNYFTGLLLRSTTLTARQVSEIWEVEVEVQADLNGDGFIGEPQN
ncbi:MAG: hypothetical protein WEB60_03545 [Terrimicrobiaceae bacterium]